MACDSLALDPMVKRESLYPFDPKVVKWYLLSTQGVSPADMRRALLILVAAIAGIGLFTGGAAWLLTDARPPAGAARGERLYYAYCVECHGRDGRGSWRAALFLLRPGNLAEPRVAAQSDRYLFDLIKHGGSAIGRPGMPAFGYHVEDDDITALVQYLRTLARPASP